MSRFAFACVECGCTKNCVPIDGPNGVTCDICYEEELKKQRQQADPPVPASTGHIFLCGCGFHCDTAIGMKLHSASGCVLSNNVIVAAAPPFPFSNRLPPPTPPAPPPGSGAAWKCSCGFSSSDLKLMQVHAFSCGQRYTYTSTTVLARPSILRIPASQQDCPICSGAFSYDATYLVLICLGCNQRYTMTNP